jgi:hypothetical protein
MGDAPVTRNKEKYQADKQCEDDPDYHAEK